MKKDGIGDLMTTPAFKITTTWHNAGPHTIWAKLAERLGREPTDKEAADEVKHILSETKEDR